MKCRRVQELRLSRRFLGSNGIKGLAINKNFFSLLLGKLLACLVTLQACAMVPWAIWRARRYARPHKKLAEEAYTEAYDEAFKQAYDEALRRPSGATAE
jgi:hypothetical protein